MATTAPTFPIATDELLTVREAMRFLNRHLEDLDDGSRDKLVLLRGTTPAAVVLSPEAYADLLQAAGR